MTPDVLEQAGERVPQKKEAKVDLKNEVKKEETKKTKFARINKISDKGQTVGQTSSQTFGNLPTPTFIELVEFTPENTPFPLIDKGWSDKSKKTTPNDITYTCVRIVRLGRGFKGTAQVLETFDSEFAEDIVNELRGYGWKAGIDYSYTTNKMYVRLKFPHQCETV